MTTPQYRAVGKGEVAKMMLAVRDAAALLFPVVAGILRLKDDALAQYIRIGAKGSLVLNRKSHGLPKRDRNGPVRWVRKPSLFNEADEQGLIRPFPGRDPSRIARTPGGVKHDAIFKADSAGPQLRFRARSR